MKVIKRRVQVKTMVQVRVLVDAERARLLAESKAVEGETAEAKRHRATLVGPDSAKKGSASVVIEVGGVRHKSKMVV